MQGVVPQSARRRRRKAAATLGSAVTPACQASATTPSDAHVRLAGHEATAAVTISGEMLEPSHSVKVVASREVSAASRAASARSVAGGGSQRSV